MAMKDPIAKLFGSVGRVKIMRLFLFDQEACMSADDVRRATKTIKTTVTRELKLLTEIGLLEKVTCKQSTDAQPQDEQSTDEQKGKKATKPKPKKQQPKEFTGYKLNKDFEYRQALRILLTQVSDEHSESLARRTRRTGRIKLLIVSGVFLQDDSARVDILVVGDAIKHRALETAIRSSEAELGQSLRYAVFSTNEFDYRLDLRDRLIMEIFESPHKKLINRLSV